MESIEDSRSQRAAVKKGLNIRRYNSKEFHEKFSTELQVTVYIQADSPIAHIENVPKNADIRFPKSCVTFNTKCTSVLSPANIFRLLIRFEKNVERRARVFKNQQIVHFTSNRHIHTVCRLSICSKAPQNKKESIKFCECSFWHIFLKLSKYF